MEKMKRKKVPVRLVTILITVAMCLVVLPKVSADCPTGMVSFWKLDEASGLTASDSFNGNHGILINGPTWTTGKVGNALYFDGDDYGMFTKKDIKGGGKKIENIAYIYGDDTMGNEKSVVSSVGGQDNYDQIVDYLKKNNKAVTPQNIEYVYKQTQK